MKILIINLVAVLFLGQLQANSQSTTNIRQEKKMKLIYVMDPQCGWCYGNSKNITQIQKDFEGKFEFELLVGGMWLGNDAPIGGESLSQFLQDHAPRMIATTGANVGNNYYTLAKDKSYAFSSLEPSAAIRLIKDIAPEKVFEFAKLVQTALLAEGKRLDQKESYLPILNKLSINTTVFDEQWMKEDNLSKTKAEFEFASSLANGYPTLVLKSGTTQVLASGYFDKDAMTLTLNKLK